MVQGLTCKVAKFKRFSKRLKQDLVSTKMFRCYMYNRLVMEYLKCGPNGFELVLYVNVFNGYIE